MDWQSSNWYQIVEILAVAALFYYLLLGARGTKGTIVVGIVITLGVLYFVCYSLQLITLKLILDKALFYGPLAILIVFAPDLRKWLEHTSKRSPLMQLLLPREEQASQHGTALDLITASAVNLREKKLGALFVLEGQEDVEAHLVPGTELQALISVRLISGLYNKHNPLHDGALLIRDDRVWSAGNFLPLSESKSLSSDLGTRHRAAVGLTERCDATVVVVSEESGELSIAHHGRLARALDPEQLSEQLAALVEPNENFASVIPRAAYL